MDLIVWICVIATQLGYTHNKIYIGNNVISEKPRLKSWESAGLLF